MITCSQVFTLDVNTQACSQDSSLGGGGRRCMHQELGPQINNVGMIGYASSEDTSGRGNFCEHRRCELVGGSGGMFPQKIL